jgi:glycosidase
MLSLPDQHPPLYQGRHFCGRGKTSAQAKDFWVDILWLMPIHEIGQKYRKGNLGSPYAVKDYYQVNSELRTLTNIKQFVASAHQQGMYVILDLVANHTAWDNDLVNEHSDWYARDWKSDFRLTPWWNWPDIIEFDYQQSGLREGIDIR